jgi:hypothetical protein
VHVLKDCKPSGVGALFKKLNADATPKLFGEGVPVLPPGNLDVH